MIIRKMVTINVSSEVILRNTFASVELKNVRGLPVKLHLASLKLHFYWLNVGQYSFYNKKILVEI